ncbi:unnamed protein product [Pleuronectes platessa]|uniref:Uncharacterized protein n=1 Tax=Pleuronectes platessa TaxID=8262 RepID=A0A9N7TZR6_PLEPL|nr:unnamed protein product [Pleuronectes platessa]
MKDPPRAGNPGTRPWYCEAVSRGDRTVMLWLGGGMEETGIHNTSVSLTPRSTLTPWSISVGAREGGAEEREREIRAHEREQLNHVEVMSVYLKPVGTEPEWKHRSQEVPLVSLLWLIGNSSWSSWTW